MTDDVFCPDCAAPKGYPHMEGCDVARCAKTGGQRLSCDHDHDHGVDTWTGAWPLTGLDLPADSPLANDGWTQMTIVAPPGVAMSVLNHLREFGFTEIDWTVLERRIDYARVNYAPCKPRTKDDYDYTIDWRDE